MTVDNGKKATVVSYNLVDGLYILQIEGESSASLLGYKKTKSWVIHSSAPTEAAELCLAVVSLHNFNLCVQTLLSRPSGNFARGAGLLHM